MTLHGNEQPSAFFAYAGSPALRAESMRDAVAATSQRGIRACGWEDLSVSGRVIIDIVTKKIDECDACVAEVSSSNPNVLFEAGYALARNKKLFLALDESDEEALKSWQSLGIVDSLGRIDYSGNSQKLAAEVCKRTLEVEDPFIEGLLSGGRPREENAIFAPGVPHKFNSAERLERLLDRKTHLNFLASQEEFGLGSLAYYVQSIYRSSAAILHFMKPTRTLAPAYNARLAFVGGIAHGFEIPLLMVAEEEYQAPLDYRDLVYVYQSTVKLTEYVEEWLKVLPTAPGSRKRLGRLKLDIELPIRTFGQYVAESEKIELNDYFVHTNEFEAVLSGRASVFTGRKGTGKTATMQESVAELRKDRRNLVVSVKPSSYDLAGLVLVLEQATNRQNRDYFLLNLWSYLLTTEIAIAALSNAESLPAGLGADASTSELAAELARHGIDLEADFTSRLDDVIAGALDHEIGSQDLTSRIRNAWRASLLPKLKKVLHAYDRVSVLIDNLDKTWEKGVAFDELSQFILSLLVTQGKLEAEFERANKASPPAHVTLTVFIRTDIYDVIAAHAREPDKINPQTIQWSDEELLIRVLEERYEANRDSASARGAEGLWERVFCAEVHGLPTRDYLLWRALPRPRDLIYLGNAALTTAINRRHDRVLRQDFNYAEFQYSRFAVEALIVESEAQGFNLEELLFEFAGLDSTVTMSDLQDVLGSASDFDSLVSWLIRTSFLGVETRDSSFVYVEGESEAKKKYKAAQRLATRMNRPVRFRVHPAFRCYLDIRDDDLANEQESGRLP
ncbi:P-loop ATPase, Sll1717 family [Rhodococcus coprophilus]|uniref:Uncharacterized protein n=1 Tax=Rhodococcus coprophilus TaxID=38310 RepID=A0A2X4UJK3_9NOCA|nr:hypothetical protein [Rhodococcus coprophilus]MBM7460272.1 hypothetical protein [Rhodococcus coprophilus]SQI38839.1 Uncharacterised protein [Rhodococcus coprophilus]